MTSCFPFRSGLFAGRRPAAARTSAGAAAWRTLGRFGRLATKSASSKVAVAGAALLASTGVLAALPFGTLEFVEPSATVSGTEQIDVRVRFTLDPTSPALSFSSDPLTGFQSADLPTTGTYFNPGTQQHEMRQVDSISGAFLNTYFSCDDTFTGGCNADTTNYKYTFFTSSQPGKPAVNFVNSFDLQPGASYEYVFAQFTPAAGGAQPGTYRFFNTGLTLNFVAFDAEGHELDTQAVTLGQTCAGGSNDACAFTRSVTAVPEPGTYGLMALGLCAIGAAARQRRRRGASRVVRLAGIAAAAATMAQGAAAVPVYLNQANTTVAVGAGTSPGSFNNTFNAGATINKVIDAPSADATEFHTQQSHVWFSASQDGGGLELRFTFDVSYDINTLHFWNYTAEGFDVDSVAFTFFDAGSTQVGQLTVLPALGTSPGITSQDITLGAPLNVRYVTAFLTGSNGEVDFQNIGFTAELSAVPEAGTLALMLAGLVWTGVAARRRGWR